MIYMKTVAIIQARMGSTRLPGKIMKLLAGKTVLEHVIERVTKSKEINEIVIATTTNEQDDLVVGEAQRLGVKSFRGSEEDVLSRYYYAAKKYNAQIVIRITSDCPLIDFEVVDSIIRNFKSNSFDYISNTLNRTFPRGLDCEVFSFDALEKTFQNAKVKYQKEHVTPYIYENNHLFKINQYCSDEDNSNFRCTLDTYEDYELIKAILERINEDFNYQDLLSILKENPDLVKINCNVTQKNL